MKLTLKEVTPRGGSIEVFTEIDACDELYIEDIKSMVVAFEKAGYQITLLDAYNAHCANDNDLFASWLALPAVEDIVETYLPYFHLTLPRK